MNGPIADRIARRLAAKHSRRQLLEVAGKGSAAGLGATLIAPTFGATIFGVMPTLAAQGVETMVNIVDFAFEPNMIEVNVGDTVTWTNAGAEPHTATADDGTFDSGILNNGGTFSHILAVAGTFTYHCEIHPEMVGTIVVKQPEQTTYVRRNVHDLGADAQELKSYAKAVDKMKSWNGSLDPLEFARSWRYQGNMHETWLDEPETTTPDPLPLGWTTCEHSFEYINWFFWPWHRMYLYWFERIIRELSEDPTFALPYWDYSDPERPDRRILPAPFLDPNNPLYIPERDSNVNAGRAPIIADPANNIGVPASTFDYCSGMSLPDFTGAAGASFGLENQPHGGIHVWVGGAYETPEGQVPAGWMYHPDRAARDPIFWLHHANLDRLWESWLSLGNANPPDTSWLSNQTNSDPNNGRPYDFFDEVGNPVTTFRIVEQVAVLADLGYQYDALADLEGCPGFLIAPGPDEALVATPQATPGAQLELGGSAPEGGIEVGPETSVTPVAIEQPESAARATNLVLTVAGIASKGLPAVIVEIYINVPPDQSPDYRTPYYIGNLYLFGMVPSTPGQEEHANHNGPRSQEFNIARNVRALDEMGEWSGELRVTFVPYYTAAPAPAEESGGTPVAVELPPGPWITIESISVTAG